MDIEIVRKLEDYLGIYEMVYEVSFNDYIFILIKKETYDKISNGTYFVCFDKNGIQFKDKNNCNILKDAKGVY